MVINTCSVGPDHVFEFQISIDLGHSHPGHPSPSSPLVLALKSDGRGLCVWEGGGHTCIHMYFIEATEECQNKGKSPQQPLTPDDLLLKQPKPAAVVGEMNFWFPLKSSEEWLGSKCV